MGHLENLREGDPPQHPAQMITAETQRERALKPRTPSLHLAHLVHASRDLPRWPLSEVQPLQEKGTRTPCENNLIPEGLSAGHMKQGCCRSG